MNTNHFKINTPEVISEHFEDEVIAIHIKHGIYYIIGQSGVPIWQQIAEGATAAEIIHHLTQAYQGEEHVISANVQHFLDQLKAADLIVTREATGTPAISSAKLSSTNTPPVAFAPPTLSENTDIQDILLLDPVHEVRKQGWFA